MDMLQAVAMFWNNDRTNFVFRIPDAFLQTPPEPASSPSALSPRIQQLPPEILLLIYASEDLDPYDQVCFAMTCKEFLQIAATKPPRSPPVLDRNSSTSTWMDKPTNNERLYMLLLKLWPRDAAGKEIATVGLCNWCFCFRSVRRERWRKPEFRPCEIDRWCTHMGTICPLCMAKLDPKRFSDAVHSRPDHRCSC